MPLRPCPRCDATVPRFMGSGDVDGAAWQYSCAVCGHHWAVSKDDGLTVRHLTRFAGQEQPEAEKSAS